MLNFNFRFLIYFSLIISSILSIGCGYSEEQFLTEVNKANENKRLAEEREARILEQEKQIEAETNKLKRAMKNNTSLVNRINNNNKRFKEETKEKDEQLASLEVINKLLKKKVAAKESSNTKLRAQNEGSQISAVSESKNKKSDLNVANVEERKELNKLIRNYKSQINKMAKMHTQELEEQKKLFNSLRKQLESDNFKVTSLSDRIAVRLDERLLFKSGTAFIRADGFKILDKIGAVLKKVKGRHIQVEGHTDNRNIKGVLKRKFATNWELSVARAISVTRYFIDVVKVDPKKLSATGFGSHQPISDNDTLEGQSINRRVEFALIPIRNNKTE